MMVERAVTEEERACDGTDISHCYALHKDTPTPIIFILSSFINSSDTILISLFFAVFNSSLVFHSSHHQSKHMSAFLLSLEYCNHHLCSFGQVQSANNLLTLISHLNQTHFHNILLTPFRFIKRLGSEQTQL